ncbi:MAG: hypothetical protein VW602_11405, partial [Paracoccaceae bacterium]
PEPQYFSYGSLLSFVTNHTRPICNFLRSDRHFKNGRLINSKGNLAGAHITMAAIIERLMIQLG